MDAREVWRNGQVEGSRARYRCCPTVGVLPEVAFLLQDTVSFSRPNPQSRCDLAELISFLEEPTCVHVCLSLRQT